MTKQEHNTVFGRGYNCCAQTALVPMESGIVSLCLFLTGALGTHSALLPGGVALTSLIEPHPAPIIGLSTDHFLIHVC